APAAQAWATARRPRSARRSATRQRGSSPSRSTATATRCTRPASSGRPRIIVYNNRAYHQETMHLQKMAGLRNRRPDQAQIGTGIYDPDVNFAKIAEGCGVFAVGPVQNPEELGPALKRAMEVVKSGHPALIDVIAQPR